MAPKPQLRLPFLILTTLLLAIPLASAQSNDNNKVNPDFSFYPQNAQACLYESSNSTNCDRPSYDVLNECLCSNTRNFITNAARCLGEDGASNLDEIYKTLKDACDDSSTPTNVEKPEFMRAAEKGAGDATSTQDGGPTSTGTDSPTSTGGAGPTNTSPSEDEGGGLSTGAHIGIGVGAAIFGALVMGGVGFWWFRRYRKRHAAESSPMLPHGDDEAAHGTPMYSASSPGFVDSKTPHHPPSTVSPPTYTGAWGTPPQGYGGHQAYGAQHAPAELPPEQGHGMAMEMEGSTTWNQAPVEMPGSTPGFTSERR